MPPRIRTYSGREKYVVSVRRAPVDGFEFSLLLRIFYEYKPYAVLYSKLMCHVLADSSSEIVLKTDGKLL